MRRLIITTRCIKQGAGQPGSGQSGCAPGGKNLTVNARAVAHAIAFGDDGRVDGNDGAIAKPDAGKARQNRQARSADGQHRKDAG